MAEGWLLSLAQITVELDIHRIFWVTVSSVVSFDPTRCNPMLMVILSNQLLQQIEQLHKLQKHNPIS